MRKPDFKAVIIEASAGTGKTSRITTEFTRLLEGGSPAFMMKKIIAITFSEKAAIEMKTRILEKIYSDIYPSMEGREKVEAENAMLKLNISTIHSFCRRMLRRFAFYLNLDPFFKVGDPGQSDLLFYRAFGKILNSGKAENIGGGILKDIKLNSLKDMLYSLRQSHPYVSAGIPEGIMTRRMHELFSRVVQVHARMKSDISMLDFDDLEKVAWRLVCEHPEALSILEDFDEKFSYVFVDEFQDTNILQWEIVKKFFEEWLAGYGAKADRGESYGIFLVGDKKQSIYKFRGAESGIFDVAQNVTAGYSERKQLSKNYRSSKPVLDFINKIFEGIYPWSEQKLYPGLDIEIPSRIEIKISEGEGVKEAEYDWVISKIFELVEKDFQVWDRKSGRLRSIDFRDMAIIMRGRAGSKFSLLEKKLKESGMPFVILGGIGFYSEPEIIFLLSLLFALSDTTDSLSLWTLFNSVHAIDAGDVRRWRKMLRVQEITVLFENILDEKGFWKDLSTQQKANAEKFLMLLQDMQHMPVYAIAKNLRELAFNYDEPKADIFSIRQNAVRVLTVHGAKGLEFPAVFLVNVEDGRVTLRDRLLYERTEGEAAYTYIFKEEADEGTVEDYRRAVKEEEERILYVALTRAGQCLFISGEDKKWGSQLWLGMIRDFERMYPASIRYNYRGIKSSARESKDKISFKEKGEVLTSYSHEAENIFYGYEKRVAGQVIHKLLFEISTGRLRFGEKPFRERAVFYLKKSGLRSISKSLELLMDIYEKIEANEEVKNIVLESMEGKTFSELAFMVEKDGKIYEGFIDRVIIRDGAVNIYDYKTEKGALADYKKQMDIYEAAAMSIFETCNTKKFVVFLREGSVRKIP